ncbi:MAG: hypothetical protein WEA77_03595 [Hyphomonas sp.]|uniref:hypothetical protein n=1 Tax=Hyphomonas sp. TaxID=87 RepID=UPI0034A02960
MIMASRQWTNRLLQHLEKACLIHSARSRIDALDLPRLTIYGEASFILADPVRADPAAPYEAH